MANKKTVLVIAAVLCLSVAITIISFSIEGEKGKAFAPHTQKLRSQPEQKKPSIPTSVPPAKQLHEKRLQVARQEYQQMKKRSRTEAKRDTSPLTKSAMQRDASWPGQLLGKRVEQTRRRQGLFPHAGAAIPIPKNLNLSPDLTVVSTYPGDQATDVPLDTIISVTFSDSLDTYAPLEVTLFPTTCFYSDPVISADGKTVSAAVALDSNTTYQLFVMAAVTPDSQRIRPQIAATFSTGSTMPTGSIYGKIIFPLDPTTNLAVAAAFSLEMMDSDEPYRGAEITSSDGSYSIENLPPGDYWLLAVQDMNGDLQIDEFDAMAFYDGDDNGEPDAITVSEGQAVGSLDFQLTVLEVVSSYPADNTLNVPTDTTLSITFSLPVDYEDEDFEPALFPPPLDQGSLSASPDGKTVSVPVVLKDSTMYQVLMMDAESFFEQPQVGPYVAYFSTGSSFPSATISGTVTFADFTPSVAFAFLLPSGWEGEEENISNVTEINLSEGSYTMIHVLPGNYYPAFFADVHGIEITTFYSDSVMVGEGDTITGIDTTMALGADLALYGRITGSGGIPEVDIEAYNTTTEDHEFDVVSNFLGYYRMMVSEGLYNVYVDPPWGSGFMWKDTTDIHIISDTELNITLESGFFISGVVTDTSDVPIPEAEIEVFDTATQDWVAWGRSDEQGEYRVAVPAGTYDIYFYPPWQSRYVGTQITTVVITADYELNVELQAGSLVDGIVRNEEYIPLGGVGVTAFEAGTWNAVSGTITDDDGYFGFGLLPGTYDIFYDPRWSYTEYLPLAVPNITVPPDTTIDVLLERGSVISGQVRDPEDNPVEDAEITAVDTFHAWITDDWTDGNGNYALSVPAGTYHLLVWPPSEDLLPDTIHYITVPPDTIVDIQLQRQQFWTMTGTVTNSNSTPMDSVGLDIFSSTTYQWLDETVITDANGIYTVQLIEDQYTIIFRLSDKWVAQGFPDQRALPPTIEIFSDTTINFNLQSGHMLTGTVTDTSSMPVENARLVFSSPDYDLWISSTPTIVDGHYATLMAPSSYLVNIRAPQFSSLFGLGTDIYFTGTEVFDFTLETIPVHDVGNVVFSWAAGRYGLIRGNNGGQGFQYPPGQSNNHLYRGYLLIAMDDSHVSEGGYFQPTGTPPFQVTIPGMISDQDGYTEFNDSGRGDPPVGITVTQHSYAYANAPDNDYVILKLFIANNDPFSKDVVIGMYFDWDIGDNSADDTGDYDATNYLGYIYSSDDPDGIHVGTAVLNAGGATSYRIYDNQSEGYLEWSNKYSTLTEGFQQTSAGPGDVRYYISCGVFTLPPAGQDSVEVAFAILAGDNLADLQANAEAAQAKYNTFVSVEEDASPGIIPKVFSLSQNYPNPFNPITDIRYQIADSRLPVHTTLRVYNLLGHEVRTLVDEIQESGYYTVAWDGKDNHGIQVASGVYFYRLVTNDFTATRRMILLK